MEKLLSPVEMPEIHGIQSPQAFYQVLQAPASLAGMAYPRPHTPWEAINKAGFQHVVCLANNQVDYDPAPLKILHSVELEDLVHGGPPADPKREERLIQKAVTIAAERLLAGEGVVVHCMGGTGRTGTVIGCLLRQIGYPAQEVLAYLDGLNQTRGRSGWPESFWQAHFVRSYSENRHLVD
jgi:protein-tyrosine phosphatase